MSDIQTLTLDSPLYPALLNEISDPPTPLFYRGNAAILNASPLLAVVGSRKSSFYGKQAIERLLTPLVKNGVPLVSGLAYGIDSIAHNLCLANNTPTIAVLGSGIDDASIYPRLHVKLANAIIDHGGVIISEFPAGTAPLQFHFPARNRIIAGLTMATLVVQAAARSGSLITARLALEYGRDVAAIPGNITDLLSAGTNQLIQQGATPLLTAEDVFALLNIDPVVATANHVLAATLTDQQKIVMAALSSTPLHVDQLVATTSLPSPVLSIALTELELLDAVEHLGGMKYVKK